MPLATNAIVEGEARRKTGTNVRSHSVYFGLVRRVAVTLTVNFGRIRVQDA